MTSILKNVCIDKLDDIADEYNNTYQRTIKMKPANVEDNTHIGLKKEINDKYPKFKVGDHVRISMLLMISMVKKSLEYFMKKNCKRLIKKNSG